MASWVGVSDGEFAAGTVREPRVHASFPTWWLNRCLLRGRAQPVGVQPAMSWFDDFLVGAAHTAVNDVPPEVTELVNYTTDDEPWLFDRTATLFGVYARTGDVKWLRHAHRSAQFYVDVAPTGQRGRRQGGVAPLAGAQVQLVVRHHQRPDLDHGCLAVML